MNEYETSTHKWKLKYNQIEILQLISAVIEMKILNGSNRFKMAEWRNSELQDKWIEITQYENRGNI